ncbi:FtsK/SpoIIIE domain-containing protein [Niallia taxi]|uniref:FtsK/SpoIIIE domain-containing protein n=1 Tax=Niallia taxi TaxID=2499688 RepID=UPI0031795C13
MSISRYIYKTPINNEQNNLYYLDKLNDSLYKSILRSKFISDNVYGIEQYSDGDYEEQFLFTPGYEKRDLEESSTSWELRDTNNTFYKLSLAKQSFFPLDTSCTLDLINQTAHVNNFPVFTQLLLCKRIDNWREILINQYDDYLNGNDDPIDNKILRNFQNKALNVLSKISNYTIQRDPIDEIDEKLLQNGYRLEVRFVIFNPKTKQKFEGNMKKLLKNLNLFNAIRLEEVSIKEIVTEIETRSFVSEASSAIYSESEIKSLLFSQPIEEETELMKLKKINAPKLSIVRQISSNHFSKGIEILPVEVKKPLGVDSEVEKSIIAAFKRVNISKEPLKVTKMTRGARIQLIECKIPKDKNFKDIKRNLENIQGALGNSDISLEIGNKPETVNFYLPCTDSELIYLKEILESDEFQSFAEESELPFIIGEDEIGNKLFTSLSEIRHLLIAGSTGSGKSVFLNCILITFILYMNPNELALYLIDPKMVELSPYEGLPHVQKVISNVREAESLLFKLTVEMDKRYELLKKSRYRDVANYNKDHHVDKIPYIVVVVDEYADLIETCPGVEDHITRLGGKARAAGIHLIIATQRPSSDILDGAIKANLPARVSFKLLTSSDYTTIFGTGIPFKPLGKGDGCALIEGLPKQYQRFQSPLITLSDKEWIDVIDNLKNLYNQEEKVVVELDDVVIEEPIDKLKRIIIENDETRVGELQRLMGIGINKVSEMMKELLEEGWLIKNGRKYEVSEQVTEE